MARKWLSSKKNNSTSLFYNSIVPPHKQSNGITESHLHCVVPYGKSHKIISIDLSGMSFINSRQSPCNKLYFILTPRFRIVLNYYKVK